MGKTLIIKDADFSANAVEKFPTDISDNIVRSSKNRMYLHLPQNNFNDCFRYSTSTSLQTYNIGMIDIHEYVGKTIYYANVSPNMSSSDDYRACFASAINTDYPPTQTQNIQNALTCVERVKVTSNGSLIVPEGALYFIFNESLNPASIYVKQDNGE